MMVVGYVLIQGSLRAEWMHPSVPEVVYTPTECVCALHPSRTGLTWMGESEEKTAYLETLQLGPELKKEFQASVDLLFDHSLWGMDAVFVDHDAALAFQREWLWNCPETQLFELSLPDDLLPKFLDATAPPVVRAGPNGKYLAALRASPPATDTVILGYEVWGVEAWSDMHTSVCYGVRNDFVVNLKASFNERGLLPTLETAREAANLNNDSEEGAVGDSRWFPIQVARVPALHQQ